MQKQKEFIFKTKIIKPDGTSAGSVVCIVVALHFKTLIELQKLNIEYVIHKNSKCKM